MNDKLKIVGIDKSEISTLENPIIGTVGLATCVGVLLYSEEHKKAIVSHVSMDCIGVVEQTLELIDKYKLASSPLKYVIIPGYYENGYHIEKVLESMYSSCPGYFKPYRDNLKNIVGVNLQSHQFAFDASKGIFVTDKVFTNNEKLIDSINDLSKLNNEIDFFNNNIYEDEILKIK